MTISAGIGIANFPFDDGRDFWRWVDLCESGGVDSIWQSDRLVGTDPNLECMTVMAALAGATRRKMIENFVLATGYNVVAIPLAAGVLYNAGVLLSPEVGAILMSLSTVIVAINAQFLRRVDLNIPSLPGVPAKQEAKPAD